MESKSEKFMRLAEKRVTKSLTELRKIGNLAGPTYEYTEKQVKAILLALNDAIGNISVRFEEPGPAEVESFQFDDWMVEDVDVSDEDLEGFETTIHDDKTG